jgi:hypothetical protein
MTHSHDHNHDHEPEHNKEHIEEHVLHERVHDAAGKVDVGAYYEHYKYKHRYRVLGLGFIKENAELAVVYQAQYGEKLMWIRPLANFLDVIDGVPRFKKVAENDGAAE